MLEREYYDAQTPEERYRTPSGSVPRPPRFVRQTSQPVPRPQDRAQPRRESQERWARASTEEPTLLRRSRNSIPTPQTERYPDFSLPQPYEPGTVLSEDRNVPPPRPAASEQAQPGLEVAEQAQPGLEAAEPPSISGLHDVQNGDAIIAVMGMTGSGKTRFVSHFCETAEAGHTLASDTTQVEAHLARHPIRGRRVIFVDTPGFDDTTRTDTEVLRDIVNWLTSAYERNIKLTGLVYLHGVNTPRVGGSARSNMRHFHQLCGDESMNSVALATTHWSRGARERESQESRHQELATNALFWKELVRNGARVFRHNSEADSARTIVHYLLDQNPSGGVHLRVQREMAAGMTLDQTTVGAAFYQRLQELRDLYERQIGDLRRDLEEMRRQGQQDRRTINQITRDREVLQTEIRELEGDLRAEVESRQRLRVTVKELQEQRTRELRRVKEQIWQDCENRIGNILAESHGDPWTIRDIIDKERRLKKGGEKRYRQGHLCLVM
ncbi:hypothetical protein B0T25DRAFT_563634 [Lasiosphaeria hispida]|uniref:G domain-containing protein n=1 Tax=Lasiosphaeria hispida TaxID=260671 RepID=A0AAJ0HXR5_9PEZI|nr:hypothetical protein B0T25DRAFT_563634 [Lasiosphaeria hispida]